MPHKPTRRGLLKTTATVAVTSALALNRGAAAWAKEPADATAGTLPKVDAVLRAAVSAQDVPGLVAMAATETGGLRGDGLSAAVSRDLPMPASPDSSTT